MTAILLKKNKSAFFISDSIKWFLFDILNNEEEICYVISLFENMPHIRNNVCVVPIEVKVIFVWSCNC